MAFILCMTMVAGSFAASPQDITKVGNSKMSPTKIADLTDTYCKVGSSVTVTGTLMEFFPKKLWIKETWSPLPWRHMTLTIKNNKGEVIYDKSRINNIFSGTAHFKVDAEELNLNPGNYNMVMSYAGNQKDKLNPCEATSTLIVTS